MNTPKKLIAFGSLLFVFLISACHKKDSAPAPGPEIISFSPLRGAADTIVTITGNNFSTDKGNITIKFGDAAVTEIVSATNTEIKVKVPQSAIPGKSPITVTVGNSVITSEKDFLVDPQPWMKLFGGNSSEDEPAVARTADGGYVIAGETFSTNNGDVGANHGSFDILVIKTDDKGNKVWQNVLGGAGYEDAEGITISSDGGIMIVGSTESSKTGDVDSVSHGSTDVWVVKLDAANGQKLWQRSFGGIGADFGNSIITCPDGYVIVGETSSNKTGDVGINHGGYDAWVVKLNLSGKIIWQKTFGGSDYDYARGITATGDGGFVFSGSTLSNKSGDVGANHGNVDCWIEKLDANGNAVWQKTFGGTESDYSTAITKTPDGGFVFVGTTSSSNSGDVDFTHGAGDVWIVKIDANGRLQWQKSIGGAFDDIGNSVICDTEGNIIVAGSTNSSNSGDIGLNHGFSDLLLVKLTSNGNLTGLQLLGGNKDDKAFSISSGTGTGYAVAGYTSSSNSGDVGTNHGMADMWLLRLKDM